VRRRGAADGLVGNTDVGDLRGHADHERGNTQSPSNRRDRAVPAWKLQASGFGAAVIVMDLYSRRIVGWAMDDHLRADLPLAALKMAISAQWPGAGLIHHSDRGVQYASENYRKVLQWPVSRPR
jgi:transposase InsO family protein